MNYFTFQGNDHDCGFTSLKMLLANLTKNKAYLYLEKDKQRENFTLDEIAAIAEKYGFVLENYTCDDDYYQKIRTPCLTLIDSNHVIVIKKVRKRHVVILDPNEGVIKLKKEAFLRRWRHIISEVEAENIHEKFTHKKLEILPLKTRLFASLISLISVGTLFLCFYLLSNQKNAYYSFLFLGVFSTTLIIEKFVLSKQVYHFDKKFIPLYFAQKKNQGKLKYYEFVNFKTQIFTSYRSILSSLLIAFTVTFLLCLNDFRNLFVLLSLILLKSLEKILFSKVEENVKTKIEISESKCFENPENCSGHALRANCLANGQILISTIKNVFYIAASFAFALLMMVVTGNSGCNYVIFHFGLYYIGSNSLSNVIDGLSNRKGIHKMEARFFDSCNL